MTTPKKLRIPAIAIVAIFTFFLGGHAFAQNPTAQAASGDCCWIDAKTGKPVAAVPAGGATIDAAPLPDNPYSKPVTATPDVQIDPSDPNRAFNSKTGQNFLKQSNGCWIDTKTGRSVGCVPAGGATIDAAPLPDNPYSKPVTATPDVQIDPVDPNRAFNSKTGQNFVRVPCPPPSVTTTPPTPAPPPPVEHASSGVPARFELGLGYSYMHPDAEVVKDLNGFNVSGFYNVNSWLAVGGEFSGLYGTATETRQFMVGDMKKDFDVKTSLDRYFYLFGPQVTWHPCEHAKVFGHVLVGGVHDRNETSFPDGSMRSSADAFALAVGAGVDFQVTRRVSVGPSFDYVPTHFTSPTGDNWQNNWRVGVVGKISF